MIVTSVVVMVYVYDQLVSVVDTITVEMDLMRLTVVSNYLQIKGVSVSHIVHGKF